MSDVAIRFIHDGNDAAQRLGEMLAVIVTLEPVDLRAQALPPIDGSHGAVVCLQPAVLRILAAESAAAGLVLEHVVFVVPGPSPDFAPIFRELRVSDYFVAPVDPHVLWRAVCAARSDAVEATWQDLPGPQRDALIDSRQSFRRLFDGLRSGRPVNLDELERTSRALCETAHAEPLAGWLAALKDHHDYTYRHSMFVCEMLLHFAWNMGVKSDDLTILAMGGMLHDIGKARISTAILDKAAPLTEAERVTMMDHPAFSRAIVAQMAEIDPRVARMAVHHHERLDGTGYPDGLHDGEIDDPVRLLAIADIYSALIDDRTYKSSLPKEKAFALMEQTRGHIDTDMLARFKAFVLDNRPAAERD